MINVIADHSDCLGYARHQGMRPTCLAFAASDLNAALHQVSHLSVEFLCHHAAQLSNVWSPNQGFTIDQVMGALATPGQPLEELYPYRPDDHAAPMVFPSGSFPSLYAGTLQERILGLDRVMQLLSSSKHVGLVVAVTQSLFTPINGIVQYDPMALQDQYHAVVAVGLGKHVLSDEHHVLVRNSWGEKWGRDGHAWLPERLLRLHLVDGFLL